MTWSSSLQWHGPSGGIVTKLYMKTQALLQARFGKWQTEFLVSIKMLVPSLLFLPPLPQRLGKSLPRVSSRLMLMALLQTMAGRLALEWWFVIVGASSLQHQTKFFRRPSLLRSLKKWRCKRGCCWLRKWGSPMSLLSLMLSQLFKLSLQVIWVVSLGTLFRT